MSSTYNETNNLISVKGFIDIDENGEIVIVPSLPKRIANIQQNNKRKPYDYYDGKGSYECHICHKKFVRKSYWKRHELSHEENFSCDICGCKFMHNIHLNQHMLVHQEKKHKCDICGIMMRYKYNLDKHRKIHIPYRDENGDIKYMTIK